MIADSIAKLGILSSEAPVPNPGAMMFGAIGEISLPDELIAIYEMGDAIRFSAYPGHMIPFERSKGLDRAAFEPSVYDSWPFFYANDYQSDEVAVIVHGPAKGYVIQIAHDGFDRIIAPDVATFFSKLAFEPPSERFVGDEEEEWIYPRELTEQDRVAIEELLAGFEHVSDPYEGESLASLAMSIMPDDEFVARFSNSLFPIQNFRAIVWGHLRKIDSDAARAGSAMYQADYEERTKPKPKTGIIGKLFGR